MFSVIIDMGYMKYLKSREDKKEFYFNRDKMAKVYVDNATNRKLGRVGLPYGQGKNCPEYKILNPRTKRCVNVDSRLGQKLISPIEKKHVKTDHQLLVCHGAAYESIPGWEGADTLDIRAEARPTVVFDLSKDNVGKKYKNKYDEILLVYCYYAAYLLIPDDSLISKNKKQSVTPIRRAFQNLWDFLKPNGLVYINNFSLYMVNIKTKKRGVQAKVDLFMDPIKDLFRVKDISIQPKQYTLILEKI